MCNFRFRRTFYPVGQGAFFTEKFLDQNDKVFFSVVYDCGKGLSAKSFDSTLKKLVDYAFEKDEIIDVLFISHFDSDHVNGIHLLKKHFDNNTKVFVPFSKKNGIVLKVLYPYVESTMNLFSEEQIFYVDDEDTESEFLDSLSLDNLSHSRNASIRSGQPLKYKDLWYYVPFDIGDNIFKQNISQIIKQCYQNALQQGMNPDEIIKKLREKYKGAETPAISKTTAINMNSLQVLSFAHNDLHKKFFYLNNRWLDDYFEYSCYNTFDWKWIHIKNASCLYTGDTSFSAQMKNGEVLLYHVLIKKVVKLLEKLSSFDCLELIQIPHHGSKYNYINDVALDDKVLSAFVNYSPEHAKAKFDSRIFFDFFFANKPLYSITDYSSRPTFYDITCGF